MHIKHVHHPQTCCINSLQASRSPAWLMPAVLSYSHPAPATWLWLQSSRHMIMSHLDTLLRILSEPLARHSGQVPPQPNPKRILVSYLAVVSKVGRPLGVSLGQTALPLVLARYSVS
jgi:hypothetical protein